MDQGHGRVPAGETMSELTRDQVEQLLPKLGSGSVLDVYKSSREAILAHDAAQRQQHQDDQIRIGELEKHCKELYDRTPSGIHDAIDTQDFGPAGNLLTDNYGRPLP